MLDLQYEDIGDDLGASTATEVYAHISGAPGGPSAGLNSPAIATAPNSARPPDADSARGSPPGGRIVMESEPIYDEFSAAAFKPGDVYSVVTRKDGAYDDPQDALSRGGSGHGADPGPPGRTAGRTRESAGGSEAPPPLMPKVQSSRLAQQLRQMTKWEKDDDGGGGAGGSGTDEDPGYSAVEGNDDDSNDSSNDGYTWVEGSEGGTADADSLGVPLRPDFKTSLRRNKRGAVKNVNRNSTIDDRMPSETAI